MKKLILLSLLLLSGCASTSQTIYAYGSLIYCHSSVEKPVKIDALDGNTVPVSGI